jgi:hypothetical protein
MPTTGIKSDFLPELRTYLRDQFDFLGVGTPERRATDHMDAALRDNNMWVRRIALLHQLGWRDKTDQQRLFNYCLNLAHEKEFFIQKAIGWALRDYARHAPDAVRLFTQKEKEQLAPLSFRETSGSVPTFGHWLACELMSECRH